MTIYITPAAADKLLTTISSGQMLRIGAQGGGASGLVFKFTTVQGPYAGDHVVHIGAVTIIIDQYSWPYSSGRTLDWVNRGEGGFVF